MRLAELALTLVSLREKLLAMPDSDRVPPYVGLASSAALRALLSLRPRSPSPTSPPPGASQKEQGGGGGEGGGGKGWGLREGSSSCNGGGAPSKGQLGPDPHLGLLIRARTLLQRFSSHAPVSEKNPTKEGTSGRALLEGSLSWRERLP